MSDLKDNIFAVMDLLASEYGWTLEYCLSLPNDIIVRLISQIERRQLSKAKLWTKLIGAASAAGFNGNLDKLDSIFKSGKTKPEEKNSKEDISAWKGQVKSMWIRMKTKNIKNISTEDYKKLNEEFENKWSSGENIIF